MTRNQKRKQRRRSLSRRNFLAGSAASVAAGAWAGWARAAGEDSLSTPICVDALPYDASEFRESMEQARFFGNEGIELKPGLETPGAEPEFEVPLEAVPEFKRDRLPQSKLADDSLSAPTEAPGAPPPEPGSANIDDFGGLEIALEDKKLWRNIDELTIGYYNQSPDAVIKDAIEYAISQWQPHLPFKLVHKGNTRGTTIRIAFVEGQGNKSNVGTDCAGVPQSRSTMNLQPSDLVDSRRARGVTIHEFGHAIGAIHEHQSPTGSIPWNKQAVYDYYARFGWDQAKVDFNVLRRYDQSIVRASAFDTKSVMLYPIPEEHVTDKTKAVPGWNYDLSAMDIAWVRQVYGMPPLGAGITPPPVKPGTPVGGATVVEGDAVELKNGEERTVTFDGSGKSHLYWFEVKDGNQQYVIETLEDPASPVILELYNSGPFTADKVVQSSKIGTGRRLLNSALTPTLANGKYFVLARGTASRSRDTYKIRWKAGAPASSEFDRLTGDARKALDRANTILKSIR
jgi:hypothetical protein